MSENGSDGSTTKRDVVDGEQTSWSCVQAYAGLGDGAAAEAIAERAEAAGKGIPVVCTPSGGAQSVRLELAADWAESLSDEALLAAIAERRG